MGNLWYSRSRRSREEREAEREAEKEKAGTEEDKGLVEGDNGPRVAWLYHSWMGWLGFIWQLVILIVSIVFFFDVGAHRIIPFLVLVVITPVVYLIFLLINWFYWGPTFTTRQSMKIQLRPVKPGAGCQVISICDKALSYCHKIRHDLEFHNDQTHFLAGILLYLVLIVFLASLLGPYGVNEFPFPVAYTAIDTRNAVVLKVIYALGAIFSASILAFIMFESRACFLKTTLCNLNWELKNRFGVTGGRDLTVTDEHHQVIQPITSTMQQRKLQSNQQTDYFSV